MNRLYGALEFRAVDEEQRIIEGVANTLALDDYDTVIEPKGARYTLPLPLLWQHRADSPVGEVISATVTKNQIRVRARIARIAEPGTLKDDVDRAWQAVKAGLVKGFSIGFKPVQTAGGTSRTDPLRFVEWIWRELSLVTLPANQEATITAVRSADLALRAASGATSSPGVPGTSTPEVNPSPRRIMTTTERIAQFEQTRAARVARMEELVDAAAQDGGRALTEAEETEYAGLEAETRSLDTLIQRAGVERTQMVARAIPVTRIVSAPAGAEPAAPVSRSAITVRQPELEPGVPMARLVRAQLLSRKEMRPVTEVVQRLYPEDGLMQRAAVAAHTTDNSDALVSDEGGVYADFVEFLRPQTIIGQFGTNGIPALRAVPFRVPLITQTGGGQGYWVGEGAPKPVTRFTWTRTRLEPLKVANIAVITDELLRVANPAADRMIRDELVNALRERLDTDFIDPAKAPVGDVSPGSITNGLTPIAAAGTGTADNVRTDVQAAFGAFVTARNPLVAGVWIMSATRALALSLMKNALGQDEFTGLSMRGGTFLGLPVIISEYVADDDVILVNAADIYLADEGGFSVDASREAAIQMDDAPTNNSATPTATTMVSMFQTNSTAIRAERTINWARRRATAVQHINGVAWAP